MLFLFLELAREYIILLLLFYKLLLLRKVGFNIDLYLCNTSSSSPVGSLCQTMALNVISLVACVVTLNYNCQESENRKFTFS